MPPQLLAETHYTIYTILFPVGTNKKSFKFAKRLTRQEESTHALDYAFDSNLLTYDGPVYKLPADFGCLYWCRRLKALEALAEARPPTNKFMSWVERHTSERNALTVAIIGLFLSVLFGFLDFLVGIAQLIVSIRVSGYSAQSSN